MSDYRRWHVTGGMYFFTVVTQGRRPLFQNADHRTRLRHAIRQVRTRLPFNIFAIVLLPDHLHTVWSLPTGDADYSTRWRQIKTLFTRSYVRDGNAEASITDRRQDRNEHGVWQRRFWEHTVRDEHDLKRCVDYLHFNPVKHGLVTAVGDWPWSSFHRFVRLGEYEATWGGRTDLQEDMYE
jgi:putative transposase